MKNGMVKTLRRLALIFLMSVLSLPLALFAVFHLVPIKTLEESIVSALEQSAGIKAGMHGFDRVFPFGLSAEGIVLKDASSGRVLFNIDGAWAGFNPVSILSGGIGVDYKASLNGGLVSGSVLQRLSGRFVDMKMEGVSILAIPALERLRVSAGVQFDGDLSISLPEKGCATGVLRLAGRGGSGAEVQLGGIPLPVGGLDSAVLEAVASRPDAAGECHVELKRLWLKGGEIEAQMHGSLKVKDPIEASIIDIVIDIWPKGRLLKKGFLLSLIEDYRTGDGIYRVPVKGRLGEVMSDG